MIITFININKILNIVFIIIINILIIIVQLKIIISVIKTNF